MDKETSAIAALTGRISKDPKSRLFVPLAEEYKKTGDIEMAIHVLLEGLKNNPDYATARTSLGKLLLAKGDIDGGQKEFQQVVKAMPDNFMAHRTLGDICIIQSKPQDALAHYKTALSLSPRDEELTALVLDVESGRDVSSKIKLTKPKTTPGQEAKQGQPVPASDRGPAAKAISPQTSNGESMVPADIPPVSQPASPDAVSGVAFAAAPLALETEEPEEVLFVEPLEPEVPAQEPIAAGLDLSMEQGPEEVTSAAVESISIDLSAVGGIQEEPKAEKVLYPETDLFAIRDETVRSPDVAQETFRDAPGEAETAAGSPQQASELNFDDRSQKSDDFTTDTLAELYIAQGFFEKAIEIYERMLDDKPGSHGLRNKLEMVKAAAAQAEAPAGEQEKVLEALADSDVQESLPAADAGTVMPEPSIFDEPTEYQTSREREKGKDAFKPEELSDEAREYVPTNVPDEITIDADSMAEPGVFRPGKSSLRERVTAEALGFKPEEQSVADEAALFEAPKVPFLRELARPKSQPEDFEPQEYVPPRTKPAPLDPDAEDDHAKESIGQAGRKETIARLENWLTNIIKEK